MATLGAKQLCNERMYPSEICFQILFSTLQFFFWRGGGGVGGILIGKLFVEVDVLSF